METVSEEEFKQLKGEESTSKEEVHKPPPKVVPTPNAVPAISSVWTQKAKERAAAAAALAVILLSFRSVRFLNLFCSVLFLPFYSLFCLDIA